MVHAKIKDTYLHARSAATDHTNAFAFVLDIWCPLGAMQYFAFEIAKAWEIWRIWLMQNAESGD